MKKQMLMKEIKCLCLCNLHWLRLFVHDDRKERDVRNSLQINSFIFLSLSLFSVCECVLSRERGKRRNSIGRMTKVMQQWNHPIIIQNSSSDGMPAASSSSYSLFFLFFIFCSMPNASLKITHTHTAVHHLL